MTEINIDELLKRGMNLLSTAPVKNSPGKFKAAVGKPIDPDELEFRKASTYLENYYVLFKGGKKPMNEIKIHMDIYEATYSEETDSFPPNYDVIYHFHKHGINCLPVYNCYRRQVDEK